NTTITLIAAVTPPAITSAVFDWTTNSLQLTGTDFVASTGALNDIIANKLSITGHAGTYTLTDTANAEIASATSASIVLSATDLLHVRGLLNVNGTGPGGIFNVA